MIGISISRHRGVRTIIRPHQLLVATQVNRRVRQGTGQRSLRLNVMTDRRTHVASKVIVLPMCTVAPKIPLTVIATYPLPHTNPEPPRLDRRKINLRVDTVMIPGFARVKTPRKINPPVPGPIPDLHRHQDNSRPLQRVIIARVPIPCFREKPRVPRCRGGERVPIARRWIRRRRVKRARW